jgi:dTDP-4-dehydrorhamnose reductase
MRIGITGANGLFGSGLTMVVGERHEAVPLTRGQADLTDLQQVDRALRPLHLDAVIHAAANPDPDDCELHPEAAFRANVVSTANLVRLAQELRFTLALISTDAVFDGTKSSPYVESDAPNPISVYGRTKLAAEQEVQKLARHWIFRVSVLFGPGRPGKPNFIDKGLRRIQNGETYVVASDQVGSAAYTLDVAAKILVAIEGRRYGLYHLSNAGKCSRLELAQAAAKMAGLDASKVIGRSMAEMERPGPRPRYTEMEMRALVEAGFATPRPWQEALADYLARYWKS